MDTQKTQARVQLGALIKRERRAAGMKKQDDLATKTALSVSVISLAERGSKVEPNTLRQIETALDFPAGSFEAYVSGRGALPVREQGASTALPDAPSVQTMSRAELVAAAMVVEEVYGQEAGDRFLLDALEKRAQASRTNVREQAG
ncbi:helix-turn-helix transcriptional regulator [Amycolatopsis rhabdoformis]|uniref:Helix-turn-helix transcriptional regulator n=1 Tax=Amycolatopsis rhabdoformis TaxID=1448059 RepID=A0ABZ1HXR3_9PSEU|nr:helix-turn-helix transcriptional regulator [Amycolatopsis rhabdoformis]WSE26155.1 helix-turn-helix transcriptional regulator [Amycolatopsis rhabdoformis]